MFHFDDIGQGNIIFLHLLGGISVHVMAETWKHLRDTLAVFVVSCVLEPD